MKIKPLVKGLLTFIPGIQRVLPEKGTGGTDSAEYCYGVWLKHLTFLWKNGMSSMPETVAELGPGDSLGVGLAAMLCGVNTYYALDVVKFTNIDINLRILDELVFLLKSRAARPRKGWPDYDEYLDEKLFPKHILNDELLEASLSEQRISAIRNALMNPDKTQDGITIKYMVPWSDSSVIKSDSVDLILSHSMLEHAVDLENTYKSIYLWLKPQGLMSHQIDFQSHGLSDLWNGYRTYPEWLWKIFCGKRPWLLNRQPHSVHTELMKKNNFKIICDYQKHRNDGIKRSELSKLWKDISEDDLTCSEAFIQGQKQ